MATKHAPEFKEQIVKEIKEVGSIVVVCRKHNLDSRTVWHWVHADQNKASIGKAKTVKELNKKILEQEMEIKVLKELLKKTIQVWNNEERL